MGVISSWILCILFLFLVADSSPIGEKSNSLHIIPFIAQGSDGSAVCEDEEAFKWTYGFHDCFITKKYADGGRDLNNIVDRILDHGEACIEVSSRECRPDFRGFVSLMNKTISQMKDYAEMYLEEIYRGRENIKDLGCIETVLNIKSYEECFRNIVPQAYDMVEENFQEVVKVGISCVNYKNNDCSKEAKTSLNRIIRIVLGVEQPDEETFEEVVKTTEASTTKEHVEDEEPTEISEEGEFEEAEPTDAQPVEEKFEDVKPTEAPMKWYDYLAWPFVQAWKWISGLFG